MGTTVPETGPACSPLFKRDENDRKGIAMADPSANDGWIPLGDSATDIIWSPLKVDLSDSDNFICGGLFKPCVPEWAEDGGVTTAPVPLAVNVTLTFQASGVRVFGSAERAAGTHPDSVVAIGLAVIDGKNGEGRAARFLEAGEGDAAQPAFVQQNLDPQVQHTLFMDFANSPSATVSISNFEIYRPSTVPAPGSGKSPNVPQYPDAQPASVRSHSTSLSEGVILAIVVPLVVLAVAIAGLFIYLRKKRRRPRPHLSLRELETSEDADRARKLQSYTAWSKHPEGAATMSGSSRSGGEEDDASDIAVLRTAMQRSGVSVWEILASIARERNGTQESPPSYGA